jgi:hypothetical protein
VEVLDTSLPELRELSSTLLAGEEVSLEPRSLMVLRRVE